MYHPVADEALAARKASNRSGGTTMRRATWHWARYGCRRATGAKTRSTMRCPARAAPQSIDAEVSRVPQRVGLIDVGTPRQIEVYGPDSAELSGPRYAGTIFRFECRHDASNDNDGRVRASSSTTASSRAWARSSFYFHDHTGRFRDVFREVLRLNARWGLLTVRW